MPAPLKALVSLLCAFGVGARLAPLLDATRRMSQWPTEDGYFMLTMGRNVGLGRGLSVAGGEMPTNGTQPLTTFIWALGYATVGPEREPGVLFALVLQLIASCATAYALYRLGLKVLAERDDAKSRSALAASVWLASPVVMPHTMNCLETGFYGLVAVLVALAYVDRESVLWSWKRTIGFGMLLGLAFWVRNDSAFLIAAVCLGYLLPGWKAPEERKARFLRVLAFGATSVVVASPWLIFNYTNFGHIMPVSGRAEALTGHFGGNLPGVPIVVAEYLMTFLPIPHSISDRWFVVLGAAALVFAALAVLIVRRRELSLPERRLCFVIGLYLLGMAAFYGLYFGAAWFLPRYFLPLSPFLALGFASVAMIVWRRLPRFRLPAAYAGAILMLAAIGFVGFRQWRGGTDHMHFQVVAWVEENVPDDAWIGAIQTGTIGFFHDRTINLDGKVNIAAYEALVEGREGEYVVNDTEIQYLADWVGMRDWMNKPAIAAHFEVVEYDEEANLAVLRRTR